MGYPAWQGQIWDPIMGNRMTQKRCIKFTETEEWSWGGGFLHLEDTGSKSPHRSELAVVAAVVEEAGAAELELVASRSTNEPADKTRNTRSIL